MIKCLSCWPTWRQGGTRRITGCPRLKRKRFESAVTPRLDGHQSGGRIEPPSRDEETTRNNQQMPVGLHGIRKVQVLPPQASARGRNVSPQLVAGFLFTRSYPETRNKCRWNYMVNNPEVVGSNPTGSTCEHVRAALQQSPSLAKLQQRMGAVAQW